MTNPWPSARGSELARTRSPCTRESGKRPTSVWKRPSKVGAAPSQGRRHREGATGATEPPGTATQTDREAAAEASHGAEATQLDIMFPDGITKHLFQEAKHSLERAADRYEQKHKAKTAAKEAAARLTKEAVELDEFGGLDDQDAHARPHH